MDGSGTKCGPKHTVNFFTALSGRLNTFSGAFVTSIFHVNVQLRVAGQGSCKTQSLAHALLNFRSRFRTEGAEDKGQASFRVHEAVTIFNALNRPFSELLTCLRQNGREREGKKASHSSRCLLLFND